MSARVRILALISLAVAINYLDRAVLGIAAPSIQQQFGLNPAVRGVVFSAFSWTYFLGQVPSGVLLDRFGTRAIYSFSLLKDPPSLAAGEITDKAYVNQRAVLKHRSERVERLYHKEARAPANGV